MTVELLGHLWKAQERFLAHIPGLMEDMERRSGSGTEGQFRFGRVEVVRDDGAKEAPRAWVLADVEKDGQRSPLLPIMQIPLLTPRATLALGPSNREYAPGIALIPKKRGGKSLSAYRLVDLAAALEGATVQALKAIGRFVRRLEPKPTDVESFMERVAPLLPHLALQAIEDALLDPQGFGVLSPAQGINPLAELSLLRQVKIRARGEGDHEALRQVWPGQRGRLCPIETPEGAAIGLRLHLATGAAIVDGRIEKSEDDAGGLGVCGRLVPFLSMSEPTRAFIGAKDAKQALPLARPEAPLVQTGFERAVADALPSNGRCRAEGLLALGTNLVVAYMPWYGHNFEDAIVVSRSAATKLAAWVEGSANPVELSVGDKLTSRHGNKGVVGLIVEDEAMPRADDGTVAEVLLNPHGLLSRMNLGALMETHVGWLARREGRAIEVAPFSATDSEGRDCRWEALRERLAQAGTPEGKTAVRWERADGTHAANVAFGVQYLMRLDHLPQTKFAVVGDAPLSPITRQPTRRKEAGSKSPQRLGEMEIWALMAHGAGRLLREALTVRSDGQAGEAWRLPEATCVFLHHLRSLHIDPILERRATDGWTDLDWTARPPLQPDAKYRLRFEVLDDARAEALAEGREATDVRLYVPAVRCPKCGFFAAAGEKIVPRLAGDDVLDPRGVLDALESGAETFAEIARRMTPAEWDALRHPELSTEDLGVLLAKTMNVAAARKPTIGGEAVTPRKRRALQEKHPELFRPPRSEVTKGTCPDCDTTLLHTEAPHPQGLYGDGVGGPQERRRPSLLRLAAPIPHPLALPLDAPPIRNLLVLPPGLRPHVEDRPNRTTGLYREVLRVNAWPREGNAKGDKPRDAVLRHAVGTLFGVADPSAPSLLGRLHGKGGLVRGYLLGKRQHASGRAVIVPDPGLRYGQCRLPRGAGDVLRASKRVDGGEWWALLNRSPTLHRYGIVACRPVLPSPDDPEAVLGLHPLLCGGLGADFDGDTMAFHLFASSEGAEDARRLAPDRHLYSVANGGFLPHLAQDIVSGLAADFETQEGRDGPRLSRDGLLTAVSARLPKGLPDMDASLLDQLMRRGFAAATERPASFSMGDLWDLARRAHDEGVQNAEDVQGLLERSPGPISTMVLSGARGDAEGVRRLILRAVERDGTPGWVEGLGPGDYLAAATAARRAAVPKKLGTPKGGDLTRRMAYALFRVRVAQGDCGAGDGETRSPLGCGLKTGDVCAACYGADPSTGLPPPPGLAIGLIAAESIGERATQDFMKLMKGGGDETTRRLGGAKRLILEGILPGELRTEPRQRARDENTMDIIDSLVLKGLVSEKYRKKLEQRARPEDASRVVDWLWTEVYARKVERKHIEVLVREMSRGGGAWPGIGTVCDSEALSPLARVAYRSGDSPSRFVAALRDLVGAEDPLDQPPASLLLGWGGA